MADNMVQLGKEVLHSFSPVELRLTAAFVRFAVG